LPTGVGTELFPTACVRESGGVTGTDFATRGGGVDFPGGAYALQAVLVHPPLASL